MTEGEIISKRSMMSALNSSLLGNLARCYLFLTSIIFQASMSQDIKEILQVFLTNEFMQSLSLPVSESIRSLLRTQPGDTRTGSPGTLARRLEVTSREEKNETMNNYFEIMYFGVRCEIGSYFILISNGYAVISQLFVENTYVMC